MASALLVTSGKGGTGKSTLSAGLATALALRGKRVIAIDADFGLRNLDLYLGLYDRAIFDCYDVAEGRVDLKKGLTIHPELPGLRLLAAPGGVNIPYLPPWAMKALVDEAKEQCDFCVIDCPAGIGEGFRSAAAGADRALMVTTPDLACVVDGTSASLLLEELGVYDVRVVVNRVRPSLIKKERAFNLDEVMDRIGFSLAGYVREDERVIVAANHCEPLLLKDKKPKGAARDIDDIARRLLGERLPLRG